jgi:hypothetical protein
MNTKEYRLLAQYFVPFMSILASKYKKKENLKRFDDNII